MRLIDADELQIKLASLSRLARSDAQKSLLGRVLYIIDQMPTITMPQWISVEDKWPQNGEWILAYLSDGNMISGSYYDAMGFALDYHYEGQGEITHWMPLPEPPDKRYQCRYADGDGVCSKCSSNGEIIYCVEGPCPYMFEEV